MNYVIVVAPLMWIIIMDTVNLKLPLPRISPKVRKAVADILTDLAPIVTQRVVEARDKASARLVESLLEGVTMCGPDMKLARMQANAIRAIVQHSEWLTAEHIGELGGFSKTNYSAPANRWKTSASSSPSNMTDKTVFHVTHWMSVIGHCRPSKSCSGSSARSAHGASPPGSSRPTLGSTTGGRAECWRAIPRK